MKQVIDRRFIISICSKNEIRYVFTAKNYVIVFSSELFKYKSLRELTRDNSIFTKLSVLLPAAPLSTHFKTFSSETFLVPYLSDAQLSWQAIREQSIISAFIGYPYKLFIILCLTIAHAHSCQFSLVLQTAHAHAILNLKLIQSSLIKYFVLEER